MVPQIDFFQVATLRRRNLELLGQLNGLDEAKSKAERLSHEHQRKCKDLQEKLELYATIHRINISEMGAKVDLNTEDEVCQNFHDTRPVGTRFLLTHC